MFTQETGKLKYKKEDGMGMRVSFFKVMVLAMTIGFLLNVNACGFTGSYASFEGKKVKTIFDNVIKSFELVPVK